MPGAVPMHRFRSVPSCGSAAALETRSRHFSYSTVHLPAEHPANAHRISNDHWQQRPRCSIKLAGASGAAPKVLIHGIIPHSNILLTIGAASWLMKAMRACGSLRKNCTARCSSSDFGWVLCTAAQRGGRIQQLVDTADQFCGDRDSNPRRPRVPKATDRKSVV
jgi:hypothetical protein